jgi:hypothetical protein
MKKLLGLLMCVCVSSALTMGSIGCKKDAKTSPAGTGSPSPTGTAKKKITIEADKAKHELKQGTKETAVKLTLKRGEGADKEVKFTTAVVPAKGLTVADIADAKADAKEAALKFDVAGDADVKDYVITITAKSDGAEDATTTVKVTVTKAKDDVAPPEKKKLEGKADPDKLSIKAGKEGTAKVSYAGDAKIKTFEVKSSDEKVATAKVKNVDGVATVTVTVLADAKEDATATITVTATGDGTMPATLDTPIMVKVDKK